MDIAETAIYQPPVVVLRRWDYLLSRVIRERGKGHSPARTIRALERLIAQEA